VVRWNQSITSSDRHIYSQAPPNTYMLIYEKLEDTKGVITIRK